METLHQTSLWHIQWDESAKLFQLTWSETTEDMTADQFKAELQTYLEFVKKYHPEKVLLDTSLFLFTIEPKLQEWVDKEINAKSPQYGVQKIAMLVTTDLFAQVSMEQTIEEANASTLLDIRFFDEKTQAMQWLNS